MTKWRRRAASAIAVAGCMAVGAAEPAAADWYLRAGIGLDRPGKTNFTDRDCSSAAPAALYGCGTGGDGAPYRSVGDFGTAIPLELGLGYAVTPAAAARGSGRIPAALRLQGPRELPVAGEPAIRRCRSVIVRRHGCRLHRPARAGRTEVRPVRAVCRGRPRRRAHPDRADPS